MDMYPKYKSPLGYSTGDNNIDSYGVDHSGFSNRDEIEYQIAREARENQIIQNYNNQGITENYPQYTTNFWGSSPENNYGFGTSKIHNNIENMQNQTNFGNSNNTQWGMNNEQSQVYNPLGNSNSTFNSGLNNSSLLSTNNMQGLNLNASAALYPQQNSFSTYSQPYQLAQNSLPNSGSDVDELRQNAIKSSSIGIQKDEGYIPHVYLDTVCLRSIGNAENINTWNKFEKVNFLNRKNGHKASIDEKRACYNHFGDLIRQNCDGKSKDEKGRIINNAATSFVDECDLIITKEEADRLRNEHIAADLPLLERAMPKFYDLPSSAQNEIINLTYNLGWPQFQKTGIIDIVNNPNLKLEEKINLIRNKLYRNGVSNERIENSRNRLMQYK